MLKQCSSVAAPLRITATMGSVLLAAVLLSGCGQKGALTLPAGASPPPPDTAASAPR